MGELTLTLSPVSHHVSHVELKNLKCVEFYERERERERGSERERERESKIERDRERQRETEGERERERGKERGNERQLCCHYVGYCDITLSTLFYFITVTLH